MRLRSAIIGLAAVVLALHERAEAQNPTTPPQACRGGRGGGRGRAVQVMTLTSTGFADAALMPLVFTQPGAEHSPPLAWMGVPDSTSSFVLLVHDVDAIATNGDDALHWLVWNIPGSTRSLPEGVKQGAQMPDGARQISATGPYYRGPAAPSSGPIHHYLFELFALDTIVDVPAVGASPANTRAAVVAAMMCHVRGKAVLVGRFRRATP